VSGADGTATAGVASVGATPFLALSDDAFALRRLCDFRVLSGVTSDELSVAGVVASNELSSFGVAGAACVAPFPAYGDLGSVAVSGAEGVSVLSATSLFG